MRKDPNQLPVCISGSAVFVKPSGNSGLGLFAAANIQSGEVVAEMKDPLIVSVEEWAVNVGHSRREDEGIVVRELGNEYVVLESSKNRKIRVEEGELAMPIWWYMNHSVPGVGMNIDLQFRTSPLGVRWVANRNILGGEELRWDYGSRRTKWLRGQR